MPGLAVPVELGAEFMHGGPAATLELLARAGIPGVDSTRTQRVLWRGGVREANAFVEAKKATRRTAALKASDLTFAAFLARQKLPPLTKTLATMMVQGFDAADPAIVSARDIADEWKSALGSSQMRPQGGYQPLLETLSGNVNVRTRHVVRQVRWRKGSVDVDGIRARKAIITLPLGVLHAGAVEFDPPIGKDLSMLVSGPVIRVAMRFRKAFWDERHPGVAFYHAPQAPFPTFWTPLPMRSPLLTAWAGGPKAAALTGLPEKDLLRLAMRSVRAVFPKARGPEDFLVHDWQADPFARGGYSYLRAGGEGAREKLRRPIANTLYFAGEATDAEEAGTVAGALRSGWRAAREILKA